MWYRLKNGKIIFKEGDAPADYCKSDPKLLKVLDLGDVLYIYDSNWSEYYKSEIVCLNSADDGTYNWGVNNYEGNEHYPLEALLLGLYKNIDVAGVVTRDNFISSMSNLDTSLGD